MRSKEEMLTEIQVEIRRQQETIIGVDPRITGGYLMLSAALDVLFDLRDQNEEMLEILRKNDPYRDII